MTRCAMCGYEFDAAELVCHSACPLAGHCLVICCPRCGYGAVDPGRARLTRLVARLVGKRPAVAPARPEAGAPLVSLAPGQEGILTAVAPAHAERARQLSQYGLAPGAAIRLVQKRPVPIVHIGETDLAIEARVAAEIYVAT